MEESKKRFLIIDGNSIMNRAFYGIKLLSTKDGLYTNAIYGFLNIYYMMFEKVKPDYVAVAFDLSLPTFRHEMYDKYKDGRRAMPDELRIQMPIIKEVLTALNITILEKEGFEADDILGTISSKNEKQEIMTYILTGDRDSLQLISPLSNVIIPTTKMGKTEYTIYNEELLKEKYGITPSQVIEVKSLMGDSSDNIPGVPGIGEKTAYSLITKYGTLDKIYNDIDTLELTDSVRKKLTENKEIAYVSKALATINKEVPIDIDYESFKVKEANIPEITKIYTRLAFKKFIEKYASDSDVPSNTNTESEFFSGYSKTKIRQVENIEIAGAVISNLKPTDIIYFCYFESSIKCSKLKDNLIFMIENNIYVVSSKIGGFSTFLVDFCRATNNKVGFDIKRLLKLAFDSSVTEFKGFNSDVVIAYHLLHSDESNYSIENILYKVLDVNMPELEKESKQQTQTSLFDMLDPGSKNETKPTEFDDNEKKYIYAFLNGIKQLSYILEERLKEENIINLYETIEIPLTETLASIESTGMYADTTKLNEFGKYLNEKLSELSQRIYKLADEEFNINSPQQLSKILYEKLKLTISKKNKEGYSTDKESLEAIVSEHEIIEPLLEYRSYSKLKSTYVEGLMSVIGEDGRIHTTFMQTSTSTGRLSSVEPNLQNIPVRTEIGSKIRECFVAEGSNIIIDADYSQIELRILAALSDDENMINAFKSGQDIHKITASQVFDVPLSEVTKDLRSKAKAVNFGIVYGISDYGLAKNINTTRQEAKTYITNYLAKYPKIDSYMKSLIEDGKSTGYAYTMYGRKRKVDELKSSNFNVRTFGERIAMNMPIQGTAADIMKIAMNNLYLRLKAEKLKSKLIMQVHDELIVEGPEEESKQVKQIIKECMETASKLKVPLEADVNEGKSWYEAK